eukprot:236284_1
MSALRKLKNLFQSKNTKDVEITEIERRMRQWKEKEQKTIRISMLGSGGVGKTTILKQIDRIYNQHDEQERKIMAVYIQDSVVGYMKCLCYHSTILHEKHNENTLVNEDLKQIQNEMLQMYSPYDLTDAVALKIKLLWNDNGIKETLKQRHYYQIHDNVAYFLDKIDGIALNEYVPTFEDYLRIKCRGSGFTDHTFRIHDYEFVEYIKLIDVGGLRSARKKWLKILGNVEGIIYVVDVASYNLKLYEDNITNRLIESMNLFETLMCKTKHIKNVTICFNKYNLFQEKIKTIPISVALDDFPIHEMNPNDERNVIYFMAEKFANMFEKERDIGEIGPLQIFRTSALDRYCIEQMFKDIIQLSVKNHNHNTFGDKSRWYSIKYNLLLNGYFRDAQRLMGEWIIPVDILTICFQFYYAKFVIK